MFLPPLYSHNGLFAEYVNRDAKSQLWISFVSLLLSPIRHNGCIHPPDEGRMSNEKPATAPLARRLAAEGLGAFFLFGCVIGSGIMAQNLGQGNDAVALLANRLATGAMLFVLITVLGPISGAHMNPAV